LDQRFDTVGFEGLRVDVLAEVRAVHPAAEAAVARRGSDGEDVLGDRNADRRICCVALLPSGVRAIREITLGVDLLQIRIAGDEATTPPSAPSP
jgi:hypothetical protein